jgi:outer membrane immunogenic protein
MRNQLFASTAILAISTGVAFASDLPTHKAPPPPAPVVQPFSWTGFYAGVEGGFGWGEENDNLRSITGYPLDHFNVSGPIGGVKAGYNQQFNSLVVGIEGDVEASGIHGSKSGTFATDEGTGVGKLSMRNTWQSSIRGRVGWAWDRVLFYGTAGLAVADDNEKYYVDDPTFTNPWYGSSTKTLVGWTAGGGIDYAIDNHWTASGEIRYADFGKANFWIPAGMSLSGTTTSFSAGFTETLAQVGLSYKF